MEGSMKAVVKTQPGPGAEMKEVEIPKPGPNQVLVKVKTTSICGSDYHIYSWNKWAEKNVNSPQIMGHELAGDVVEIGENVESIKIGDFVSAETHIICGHCYQCKTGQYHICVNTKILGVHTDGVFADYAVVDASNIWKNDSSVLPEYASIQEPLGNAIDTIRAGDVNAKNILITGAGPAGLLSIPVAKAFGAANIIVSEPNEYRRNLANELGADHLINPLSESLDDLVYDVTDGIGVDFVAEMSGNSVAINQGLKQITPGGSMALLGLPAEEVKLDLTKDLIFKGINLIGVTGREMFKTWYIARRLLKENMIDLEPIITHRFPLEEFDKGMELMKSGNCGKIILLP